MAQSFFLDLEMSWCVTRLSRSEKNSFTLTENLFDLHFECCRRTALQLSPSMQEKKNNWRSDYVAEFVKKSISMKEKRFRQGKNLHRNRLPKSLWPNSLTIYGFYAFTEPVAQLVSHVIDYCSLTVELWDLWFDCWLDTIMAKGFCHSTCAPDSSVTVLHRVRR